MGYWVDVQVKFDWDLSQVPRDGGPVAGKAVANLLQLLHTYCYRAGSGESNDEVMGWFAQLERHYPGRLCDLGDFLALDDNYKNDDDDPVVGETFHTTWVQNESLLKLLYRLRDAIQAAGLPPKWWYERNSTDEDILDLIHSLNLVNRLGGHAVRLFIA